MTNNERYKTVLKEIPNLSFLDMIKFAENIIEETVLEHGTFDDISYEDFSKRIIHVCQQTLKEILEDEEKNDR